LPGEWGVGRVGGREREREREEKLGLGTTGLQL